MPHATHIRITRPREGGLYEGRPVILSFYVPSDMVTPDTEEVLIRAYTGRVIRVPQTLMGESDEPGYVVFETQVPSDVAAAVRSMCEALFGPDFIERQE